MKIKDIFTTNACWNLIEINYLIVHIYHLVTRFRVKKYFVWAAKQFCLYNAQLKEAGLEVCIKTSKLINIFVSLASIFDSSKLFGTDDIF